MAQIIEQNVNTIKLARPSNKSIHWILAVVCCVVFWRVFSLPFIMFDDNTNIYRNFIITPEYREWLLVIWSKPYYNMYIPVTYTIWGLIVCMVKQPNPIVMPSHDLVFMPPIYFHVLNLLLHIFNVTLVFRIVRSVFKSRKAAFFGALVFAIHPLQVEPVCWVSGMRELLSTFFALWCLINYVNAVKAKNNGSRRFFLYCTAFVLHALALLSKPTSVSLPLTMMLFDYLHTGRSWKYILRATIPFILLSIADVIITRNVQPVAKNVIIPIWERIPVALDTITFYLGRLIWPVSLCMDYGRSPIRVLSSWYVYITPVMSLLAFAAVYKSRKVLTLHETDSNIGKTIPYMAYGGIICLTALSTLLGFIPFEFQSNSTVADRYMYFPMLGIAFAAAGLYNQYLKGIKAAPIALLAVLGMLSIRQTSFWTNDYRFWHHALAINPQAKLACANLGTMYKRDGNLPKALEAYRILAAVRKDHNDYRDLAVCYYEMKQLDKAESVCRYALQKDPSFPDTKVLLGTILAETNRPNEALPLLQDVSKQHSDNLQDYFNLYYAMSLCYYQKADIQSAVAQITLAAKFEPFNVKLVRLIKKIKHAYPKYRNLNLQ